MDARFIPMKMHVLLAMAACAGLAVSGCREKDQGRSSTRSDPEERHAQATEFEDTAFVESFYGPPASDWRFTPGTSIYDFEKKGMGGTGSDSSAKDDTAR